MQIVKKAKVGKMITNGRLYGRIQVLIPGWLVGKEVAVIVWTEPTIEEATLRKKGVKLWREDEHGNVVEVKPENVKLKPKPEKKPEEEKPVEVKPEEKPIEEIEVKLKPEAKFELKPEDALKLLEELDRERKQKELANSLRKYLARREKIGDLDV
jgi:hypothetical protein